MRIEVTHHAAEQYVARHEEGWTKAEAHAFLVREMPGAARVRNRGLTGDPLWRLPNGVVVVAKDERGRRVVVTVLPAGARDARGSWDLVDEDDLALALESASGPTLLDKLEAREAGVSLEQWMAMRRGATE